MNSPTGLETVLEQQGMGVVFCLKTIHDELEKTRAQLNDQKYVKTDYLLDELRLRESIYSELMESIKTGYAQQSGSKVNENDSLRLLLDLRNK